MTLHWRVALWIAGLVALSFPFFGFSRPTYLFASLGLILAAVLAYRLRRQYTEPISGLREALRRAFEGELSIPYTVRGRGEVPDMAAELRDWSQSTAMRIQELSLARLRLESILKAMAEGVLVFNDDGRVILANDPVRTLLELSRDPIGRTCLEVCRNESLDVALRAALGGETPNHVEFQAGSGRVVRALVSPVTGEDGSRVEAAVAVLQDLTDIRRADRIRRDFVANVSHEFKTPLTSIRGYAETMMSEAEGPHREFADIIHRNARYLESLVDDLLALARLESGPVTHMETVDIQSVVNQQVGLRRKLPDARALRIEVDCPSIELRTDASRLGTALSNLIDNAIRYNRPSGEIRIHGCRQENCVLLAISDSGYGIPDQDLPRIFERFYRVDKSRVRNGGGTGLGLAIARHAVESVGGELKVESKLGAGSTFTIRLPFE